MKPVYFLKVLCVLMASMVLLVAGITPLLYSQVREVLFNLNLEKNREQAERLATLISIDLEQGAEEGNVLKKIQDMLETTPQSQEHFACIIKDKNMVIAHPKPSNVGKDVTGWIIRNDTEEKTFTQSAGEGVPFGGVQVRTDGSKDISYQVPISTKPWSVCVHTKLDIVDQQAQTILYRVAWILLPALFVLVFISSLLIVRIRASLEHN